MNSFLLSFLDTGAYLAIFFIVLEVVRSRTANAGAAGMHFWWAFMVASNQVRLRFMLQAEPVPVYWFSGFITLVILVGPLHYAQVTTTLAGTFRPLYKAKWFMAIFLLAVLVELYFWQAGWMHTLERRDFSDWLPRVLSLVVIGLYSIFFILSWRAIRDVQKTYQIGYRRSLLAYLFLPLIVLLPGIFGFALNNRALLFICGSFITIGGFIVLWMQIRYPLFFNSLQYELSEKKYAKTQLTGINMDALEQRLKNLMDEQRLYKDDDLRIQDLAAALMVSPNQLSRILNERYNQNFYQYINQFRIGEAQQMLVSEPDKTVLYIGLEVGFKSKSAFHINFTRTTGLTPLQYRNKHRTKI